MDKPLVSVLTVTRNRGNLLKRCITSILSQTYDNIEHIVVDGASDDNTDEVVKSFRDDRLKFVKLDYNWPMKESIDYGVSLCKGKYLTFLDSDDEYLPTKIEKQVKLIESLPEEYGFVYCWMTHFDSSNNNKILFVHNPQLRGFVGEDVVSTPVISGTPTLMFRIDFFRQFGGWKSRDEIGLGSDWEMCARACQLCKIDFIPESLVNVYVNHGSVRVSDNQKYYSDFLERNIKFSKHFLNLYKDIFEKNPKKSIPHFESLVGSNFKLGRMKEGWPYYKKLLTLSFTIKNLVRPFFGYIYYLRYGRNKQREQ